ncbi:zinc ribbon domain-containing protein [Paenibacillus tritici]|uniref:zinc ribbon domain-containing protein n=1 Tax=Paenibacillus tritici TaxID=1873425 RepID=UPI001BADB23D|nr:zinc ribbon domain-containing protein [Paenibacillus tritici]QUL53796.1 zinc ribbon domain-containing protein [Paenibacillus tritici]
MGIVNELGGLLPGREGQPSDGLPKYERTTFDYVIIGIGYLFMPLGLVLALVRMLGTHYKNYRKPVNYSLLFHVFVGGFLQMMGFIVISIFSEEGIDVTVLITLLILFSVVLLLPASAFARSAAKARFRCSQLANQYVALITAGRVRYIGNLADRTGQSEGDVNRDLLYLQKYGVLDSGLLFPEGADPEPQAPAGQAASSPFSPPGGQPLYQQPRPQQLPKSVRCPGCGAQNTVAPDQSKSCDYCGTTLAYG